MCSRVDGQVPAVSTFDIEGIASCAVGGRLDTEAIKVAFMDVVEEMIEGMIANHIPGDNLSLNAFVMSATIDFHHPEGVIGEIAVAEEGAPEFDIEIYDVETVFTIQHFYDEAFEDVGAEDEEEPRNMAYGGITD